MYFKIFEKFFWFEKLTKKIKTRLFLHKQCGCVFSFLKEKLTKEKGF